MADGPVEMNYGFARVSFVGSETVAQLLFGPEDREPPLGVVALGNTGITVDPRSRMLRRVHAKALKHPVRSTPPQSKIERVARGP
jgi:hypothetical protein